MLSALRAHIAAQRGAVAENRAEAYLQRRGLRSVARNWRCPLGELDVVMADGETLVVVEVRSRSTTGHGGALESIDAVKRRKLVRATLAFVQAQPAWQDAPIRFDVVCFEGDDHGHWLKNAFDADELT